MSLRESETATYARVAELPLRIDRCELLPLARQLFAGHAGLEAPYSNVDVAAGELTEILAAGYKPAAGVFGVHRFHHVAGDDERCVAPEAVAAVAAQFKALVEQVCATPDTENREAADAGGG